MSVTATTVDRRWPKVLLALNALLLVAVALWFRCWMLDNIPGINGDEAWYGVMAEELSRGTASSFRTPTGNLLNPFFLGPLVLLHLVFAPSVTVLRAVAAASGVAGLAVNWLLARWVFDRRTAVISTVMLAVLPVNIAYSRFAWDASQSLAATLPVLYFSLAAVRFPQQRSRWLVLAVVAELVAVVVHPTNVILAVAIFSAVAGGMVTGHWSLDIGPWTFSARRWLTYAGFAVLLVVLVARLSAVPDLAVLYAHFFLGETVYQYLAGSHSWLTWPARGEAMLLWLILVAAITAVWRSWKTEGRAEDWVLVTTWSLSLAGFALVGGPGALQPGFERYALCLIVPGCTLAARAASLAVPAAVAVPFPLARKSGQSWGTSVALAVYSLAGWIFLGDFCQHYFVFICQTGGQAHLTFRTASVDPKQAALDYIQRHHGPGLVDVAASQWWTYWPLRYLALRDEQIQILGPENTWWAARPNRRSTNGREWYVEFYGEPSLDRIRSTLPIAEEWRLFDFGGRPVICVLGGGVSGTAGSPIAK